MNGECNLRRGRTTRGRLIGDRVVKSTITNPPLGGRRAGHRRPLRSHPRTTVITAMRKHPRSRWLPHPLQWLLVERGSGGRGSVSRHRSQLHRPHRRRRNSTFSTGLGRHPLLHSLEADSILGREEMQHHSQLAGRGEDHHNQPAGLVVAGERQHNPVAGVVLGVEEMHQQGLLGEQQHNQLVVGVVLGVEEVGLHSQHRLMTFWDLERCKPNL